MKCTIEFRMDNAAFERVDTGSECAQILRELAETLKFR